MIHSIKLHNFKSGTQNMTFSFKIYNDKGVRIPMGTIIENSAYGFESTNFICHSFVCNNLYDYLTWPGGWTRYNRAINKYVGSSFEENFHNHYGGFIPGREPHNAYLEYVIILKNPTYISKIEINGWSNNSGAGNDLGPRRYINSCDVSFITVDHEVLPTQTYTRKSSAIEYLPVYCPYDGDHEIRYFSAKAYKTDNTTNFQDINVLSKIIIHKVQPIDTFIKCLLSIDKHETYLFYDKDTKEWKETSICNIDNVYNTTEDYFQLNQEEFLKLYPDNKKIGDDLTIDLDFYFDLSTNNIKLDPRISSIDIVYR